MMNIRWSRAATLVLALIAATAAPAQPPAPKPKAEAPKPGDARAAADQRRAELIQSERPAIEAREHRIDAELKDLDRAALKDDDWAKDWAGTYYDGDGLATNVLIKVAPKGGITYTWDTCTGLYDANHGDIVQSFTDGLSVKLVIDEQLSAYKYMSSRLYFVRWGDRRYLVPEAKMDDLVSNYNEGGDARASMVGIPRKFEGEAQRWQRQDAPRGRPELPLDYVKLIIEKPVTLKLTRAQMRGDPGPAPLPNAIDCYLELNGGLNQGIHPGVKIKYGSGMVFGWITITRVDADTCKGTLHAYSAAGSKPKPPAIGTEFSLPGADAEPSRPKPASDPRE